MANTQSTLIYRSHHRIYNFNNPEYHPLLSSLAIYEYFKRRTVERPWYPSIGTVHVSSHKYKTVLSTYS